MFSNFVNSQTIFYYGGAIAVFSIMVLAHELGHFFMAKIFGIRVLEFSMGFGPTLLLWKKNNQPPKDQSYAGGFWYALYALKTENQDHCHYEHLQ